MSDFHGHTETTSSKPRPDWPIAVPDVYEVLATPVMPVERLGAGYRGDKLKKPVAQYTLDDELVATYSSTIEAGAVKGFVPQCVAKAARGIQKTAHGFKWKYIDKKNLLPAGCKRVYQYTLEGELLGEFPSTKEAAIATNGSDPNIAKSARDVPTRSGKRRTSGGFIWSYKPLEDS